MKLRVYYEDTDTGGIVYHTNYLKYCERARSELFFSKKMTPVSKNGGGFVVHTLNAKFLGSAKLGDMLHVQTEVLNMKNTSITLLQEVTKDGEKIFSMDIVLVFTQEGKPKKVPQEFKDIFLTTTQP